jgi:hypothetical protein
MKQLLILFLFFSLFNSFGQAPVKQPVYWWASKFQLEDFQDMPVGSKILFIQHCLINQPAEVPTGIIFYENVYYQKEHFSMGIEFKDTVVASVTYFFKEKQWEMLKVIGYSGIRAYGSAIKGQWIYTLQEEKRHTVIVGDKKKIVVVQTI